MTETARNKWDTYSSSVQNALLTSVRGGHDSVSFTGRAEKEAAMLYTTPQSPFESAIYGDGDWNKLPTCYVLSDEIKSLAEAMV